MSDRRRQTEVADLTLPLTARKAAARTPSSTVWLVAFGLLVVGRLFFAANIPLTEDEAYYRLWAQHLAFGDYDHPPLVAWAIAAGVLVFGDDALGVRALAVAASTLTMLAVIDIARQAGADRSTRRRAAVWYAAAPLIGFGAILAIPDVFASLFWALCLSALMRTPRARAAWLLAGASAGLALLSKYSALFLGPAVLWWLLRSARGRSDLKTPWPYLALVVAGLVVAPNLMWNASHHWETVAKQFGRIAPRAFTPAHLLTFVFAFAALVNPLALPFLARAFVHRPAARAEPNVDLLWISGAPFLAYLVLHALHATVQAHWPAPACAALMILAAMGTNGLQGRWRALAQAAPAVGIGLSLVALLHLAWPATDWRGHSDPARDIRGWPAFAARLEDIRRSHGAGWVGMLNYGDAAQLAAQWSGRAPVLQITERRRYAFAPPPRLAGSGIVVDLVRRMATARLGDCFAVVRPLAPLTRSDAAGRTGATYALAWVAEPRRDVATQGCRTFHDGRADP